MKTTLNIDDSVMERLKLEAARQGRTMSEMVEDIPALAGNLCHDAHTAALMLEHGVRTIFTRDTAFHRFPGIDVRDPLLAD